MRRRLTRPNLPLAVTGLALLGLSAPSVLRAAATPRRPNVLLVVADQWRAQAFGFAGDPNARTPNLDRLERESINLVNAVAGLPVCSPTRASLLTGQRPLTHGVFLNDVPLNPEAVTLAKVLQAAGYDTGYIGKWHLNGDGRSAFIPRERRQGFNYWKALECTHDYSNSFYYADGPERLKWPGYDAIAQTRDAERYLRRQAGAVKPFFLVLAWGPPHDPYFTAPAESRARFNADQLTLRPNVPAGERSTARRLLAGYYAHGAALDDCLGELLRTLQETGLAENTIVVFTADHGDQLGSHGLYKKQKPFDESVRVPMLFHWPAGLGRQSRRLPALFNSEDLMPTVLGLCGVAIPGSVEGLDYSRYLRGGRNPGDDATVIRCVAPFGEWDRRAGGREYRELRTPRFSYVRDLNGPWLLFDNRADPYQRTNLVNAPAAARWQARLEKRLARKLRQQGDRFQPAAAYLAQWNYRVDANGTAPYAP